MVKSKVYYSIYILRKWNNYTIQMLLTYIVSLFIIKIIDYAIVI